MVLVSYLWLDNSCEWFCVDRPSGLHPRGLSTPLSVSLINHKPDYCLTGLYYDLNDKQLTNQKAVDSSGSCKAGRSYTL